MIFGPVGDFVVTPYLTPKTRASCNVKTEMPPKPCVNAPYADVAAGLQLRSMGPTP